MAASPLTPEEQLLKLIEEPGGSSTGGAGGASTVKHPLRWLNGLAQWRRAPLDLRWVARALWVALAVLAAHVVMTVLRPRQSDLTNLAVPASAASIGTPVITDPPGLPLQSLSHYLDGFQRNPFTGRGLEQNAAETAAPVTAKSVLQEKLGALKLVGITRGPVMEALVEDAVAQRTVVVREGDEVNGLMVTAIDSSGIVTVEYDDETAELR